MQELYKHKPLFETIESNTNEQNKSPAMFFLVIRVASISEILGGWPNYKVTKVVKFTFTNRWSTPPPALILDK